MKMSKIKGQKGLLVFSDPAGAKACLALAKSLKQKTLLIISDRKYSFYSEFNLKINLFDLRSIKEWFNFFKPDFVFTGTSIPNKIELKFLKEAKNNKIKTYSFVDHWTNISERFKNYNEYLYPDELWLIDEYAKEKALKDGIDENIIVISGNPYYDYLKNWKPIISKDKLFQKIRLRKNEKYILYAPEPLSKFNLQKQYGFDELSGLIHLNKSLKELKLSNIKIVVKAHPNQQHEVFESYISKQSNILYLKNININDLIYYCECVVGFFSNSIIESFKMNKKVLRIMIDLIDKKLDFLRVLNIGNIINNKQELNIQLKKLLIK